MHSGKEDRYERPLFFFERGIKIAAAENSKYGARSRSLGTTGERHAPNTPSRQEMIKGRRLPKDQLGVLGIDIAFIK